MWQIIPLALRGMSRSQTWPKQVPEQPQTSKNMETSRSTLHVPARMNIGGMVKNPNDSHTYGGGRERWRVGREEKEGGK